MQILLSCHNHRPAVDVSEGCQQVVQSGGVVLVLHAVLSAHAADHGGDSGIPAAGRKGGGKMIVG